MDQYELLRLVTASFERLSIRHFVTGSIASSLYGEYRATHDIDIVADLRNDPRAGSRILNAAGCGSTRILRNPRTT